MASKVNYVLRVTDTFEAGDREDVIMHIGFASEDKAFEYANDLASELMSQRKVGDKMFVESGRNERGVLSCCVTKYRDCAILEWACRMTVEPVIDSGKAYGILCDKVLA